MSLQNKNRITLPFQANIWKILYNVENHSLILELRDEDLRQTSFVAIDLKTDKVLWSQNSLQEKWWIGLVETKGKFVLLHGYKELQSPVHLKSFVLDAFTGNLLWKNEGIKPIGFNTNGDIIGKEEGKNDFTVFNSSSGEIINNIPIETINKTLGKSVILNPQFYSNDNKYFEKLALFIQQMTELKPDLAVEYLEYKGRIILSFYVKKSEKLVNYIAVFNEDGEVLSFEEIGSNLNAASPDSFFLVKDKLVYVKNKKELVIFEL